MDLERSLQILEVTAQYISDDDHCDALEVEVDKLVTQLSTSSNAPKDWNSRIVAIRKQIENFRLAQGSDTDDTHS